MLDFICELDRVVGTWPEDVSWSVAQVADATGTGVPQVVDILSDALGRELEVHESVSHQDATQALTLLKDRMSAQLEARQRRIAAAREKAIRAYDATMEKVRVLQMNKNWRNAYKTLSYYVGRYEKDLPEELLLTLCGECMRLGIKAETNLQELSMWFRKGVSSCQRLGTPEAIEDALDFIDAYRDDLMMADDGQAGRGRRLIGSVLGSIEESVRTYNLTPQFDSLIRDLGGPVTSS